MKIYNNLFLFSVLWLILPSNLLVFPVVLWYKFHLQCSKCSLDDDELDSVQASLVIPVAASSALHWDISPSYL